MPIFSPSPRTSRFVIGAAALLASALSFSTTASAETFSLGDNAGGLRFDVYTWDGRACVIHTSGLATGACAPGDPIALRTTQPTPGLQLLGSAVVHFDGWDLGVRAVRIEGDGDGGNGIEPVDMMALARKAIRGALAPGDVLVADGTDGAQVDRTNGVPRVRATPVIQRTFGGGAPQTVATVEYVVCALRGLYEIEFTAADASRAPDVTKIADNAIATLQASPPRKPGGSAAYRAGALFGRALMLLVLAGAAATGLLSRKKRAPGAP